MPIVHPNAPYDGVKQDQFDFIEDDEMDESTRMDFEQMKKELPTNDADILEPVPHEDDRNIDLALTFKQDALKSYVAEVSEFQILKVLGQGSFGKVFMVKKVAGPKKGEFFAMKVLKKASLKVRDRIRTKMERDILVSLEHPFIVKLHFSFQTEGKLYLILDLVRGGDLFAILSKEIMFTEDDAKFYLAEIAMAIGHIHKCGIVYRDLKPENILLGSNGHIKLTDFGLCKEAIYTDKEKTFSFCGTIEYMSPEVITRKGHGPAADWWSFGVLLYEMLTGTLPFHSSNRKETMGMIINAKLGMPNFLSPDAQKIVRALFKRIPENRLGFNNDFEEFKEQPFFESIDFEKLYNLELEPPFKPPYLHDEALNKLMNSNKQVLDSPFVTSTDNRMFSGFNYVAPLFDVESSITNPAVAERRRRENTKGYLPIRTGNIKDDYEFIEIIHRGTRSIIYRTINRTNNQSYAVKVMRKNIRDATEEIEVLLRFSEHPNIATLRDVFDDGENYLMVMEYLRGGDLLERINKTKGFSEKETAYLMDKIIKTVDYLHRHGVVHRDLQPSNILFLDDSGKPDTVRIIDFELSKQIRADNGLLMTPCFTANFVAPEVLKKKGYDQAADIWSLGIIMYVMLSGTTPFVNSEDDNTQTILERIGSGYLDLTSGIWPKVSDGAKELIAGMLNVDPLKRLDTNSILEHPWIAKKDTLSTTRLNYAESHKIKNAMKVMFSALQKHTEVKPLTTINNSSLMMKRANKKPKKI